MKRLSWLLILLVFSTSTMLLQAQDAEQVQFVEVASGLTRPLNLAHAGDSRLFVVEQDGLIRIIDNGAVNPTPFLDVSSLITTSGQEQGLLGLAFHPNYAQNGWFFINYTNTSGDTVVARYNISADPNVADPNSAQTVLTIDQPYSNHNGGHLVFGPDGMLYIGMGDGGSGGDPQNRAQNPQTLLGKMLRINVDQLPYTVPADNPFVGNATYLPEIWALGLRNPWRYSFDRGTGDLYIGDVGQNMWEEVNFQAAGTGGQNYGWNIYEGTHQFKNGQIQGATAPFAEYDHNFGCSVTGGYVYRGTNIPVMQGVYLYGDFCSGRIWASFRDGSGAWQVSQPMDTNYTISAFGEDAAGELYIVNYSGSVVRLESTEPTATSTPLPTKPTLEPSPTPDIPTETPLPTSTPSDPTTATLRVDVTSDGQTVNAALNLLNVSNVYGLEAVCAVDPAVLGGTAYTEGDFNSGNSYFVDQGFQPNGSWLVAMSRLLPNPPVNGNVNAITLNYNIVGAGDSAITCSAVSVDQNGNQLPIDVLSGVFVGTPGTTETMMPETPLPTETPIVEATPTETPFIPTLEYTETPFIPTLPASETPIVSETPFPTEMTPEVTLEPTLPPVGLSVVGGLVMYQNRLEDAGITAELLGADETTVLDEVVTGADGVYVFSEVPLGTYSVRLSGPQHLTIIQPNVLVETDGQVVDLGTDMLPAGDIDGNGVVDLADAILVGANFNVEVPPAPFEPDLNADGFVNIVDLVLVGGNLGLQSPITVE